MAPNGAQWHADSLWILSGKRLRSSHALRQHRVVKFATMPLGCWSAAGARATTRGRLGKRMYPRLRETPLSHLRYEGHRHVLQPRRCRSLDQVWSSNIARGCRFDAYRNPSCRHVFLIGGGLRPSRLSVWEEHRSPSQKTILGQRALVHCLNLPCLHHLELQHGRGRLTLGVDRDYPTVGLGANLVGADGMVLATFLYWRLR